MTATFARLQFAHVSALPVEATGTLAGGGSIEAELLPDRDLSSRYIFVSGTSAYALQ